jgi:alkylhydroperoxidase family enzyme
VALRAAGWSDAAILEAVEVIGFFNYYNRLADALGVEPEPEWKSASSAGSDHGE